jgi:pyruvate dehydrogenase E2 component (dihydrolipoamide acetyltransferase)
MAALEVRIPNIGGFKDVGVIDVLVKPGDAVNVDDPLVTLESDKATMDVPSPAAGTVREVRVQVGSRVSEGSLVLILEAAEGAPARAAAPPQPAASPSPAPAPPAAPPVTAPAAPAAAPQTGAAAQSPPLAPPPSPASPATGTSPPAAGEAGPDRRVLHASPSVRRFARELGVDLSQVAGSGPRGRILREDVQGFVKQVMSGTAPVGAGGGAGLDLLPWPRIDFARFGPVETRPLSRIQKIAGANLARNWVMIPHVTQFEEADVTELESFRTRLNGENGGPGVKVTLLAFLVKACVAALKRFPELNASLDGDSLVLKRYFHIGFAADTPNGLVVPVVREADRKGVVEIARELAELAARAREGKLAAADLQGGSFSISSLGGIGGTAFTPIINAPEVAILGVSRTSTRPLWDGGQFAPRLMLPLSLSYDHRVVDGALAARFTTHLARLLADPWRMVL